MSSHDWAKDNVRLQYKAAGPCRPGLARHPMCVRHCSDLRCSAWENTIICHYWSGHVLRRRGDDPVARSTFSRQQWMQRRWDAEKKRHELFPDLPASRSQFYYSSRRENNAKKDRRENNGCCSPTMPKRNGAMQCGWAKLWRLKSPAISSSSSRVR
jgi:hypothetical protein